MPASTLLPALLLSMAVVAGLMSMMMMVLAVARSTNATLTVTGGHCVVAPVRQAGVSWTRGLLAAATCTPLAVVVVVVVMAMPTASQLTLPKLPMLVRTWCAGVDAQNQSGACTPSCVHLSAPCFRVWPGWWCCCYWAPGGVMIIKPHTMSRTI